MSLTYPIATSAAEALSTPMGAARIRYDAERAVKGQAIIGLVTEWLKPDDSDLENVMAQANDGPGNGFIQYYEDTQGRTVLAVTFWKLDPTTTPKPAAPPKVDAQAAIEEQPDHTDDLYFKQVRNRKTGKSATPDPNQLDLFASDGT